MRDQVTLVSAQESTSSFGELRAFSADCEGDSLKVTRQYLPEAGAHKEEATFYITVLASTFAA